MQRLNRLRDDRGAVAVWVAILMVPLMVVAALALDIGAMHTDRQRLQTGADSAALAIAQQCARGELCTDASADSTAQDLATANDPQGGPSTADAFLDAAAGVVEVDVAADRSFLFAPVIGETEGTQTRVGAAAWGYPTGGGSLPLTFSWCEVLHFTGATPIRDASGAVIGLDIHGGAENVVLYSKSNQARNFHLCPSGSPMPPVPTPNGVAPNGGFGWLLESASTACAAMATEASDWYATDTGNDTPDHCTEAQLRAMIGQTILIPVFDRTIGTGAGAEYHIFGYIGFRLDGFFFGNNYKSADPPCRGDDRCISGDIVEFVDYASGSGLSPSGPQLGSQVVRLMLPEER